VLTVDDKEVAKQTIPHTIPIIMTMDETFDVGVDTRTAVDDRDYKLPFRFNGTLTKVTFNLGPVVLTEPDRKAMHQSIIKAKD
jgi:arylsulfatase